MNKVITITLGITLGLTILNTYCINRIVYELDRLVQAEVKEVAIIDALTKNVWGEVTK